MDRDVARAQALEAINGLAGEDDLGNLIIVDALILETRDAWYFPLDSAAFVLDGDIRAALAGNIPVRVAKDGSGVHFEDPGTA